jgi:Zn-finger nucleic acid-binding protein
MKGKAKPSSTNELQLELKYCERCGGLWLRPVGGGQIYCVTCGREMTQLPPPSKDRETAQLPQGPRWGRDEDDADVERHEDLDLDAGGGLA